MAETRVALPEWLVLRTRRVLNLFIGTLARVPGWKTIYIISPWISEFTRDVDMTFGQFLKRLKDDDATLYVVTRPMKNDWHREAVDSLMATRKANVATLPRLHTKLFGARTARGNFVMIGSANFTQASLRNRELGVLVRSIGDGARLVSELFAEAADIYRAPGRHLIARKKLKIGGR